MDFLKMFGFQILALPSEGRMRRIGTTVCSLLLILGATRTTNAAEPIDPEHAVKFAKGLELFRGTVRTLIVGRCVECHGGEKTEGEFNLATREGLLKGGAEGAAVVPGNAAKSRLIELVKHVQDPHMPAKGARLSANAIAAIEQWIDLGAPYDKPLVVTNEAPDAWIARVIDPEARKFWSFLPLKRSAPPEVKTPGSCRNAIDHFILSRLESEGLTLSPPIDKRRLIRRATFDLTGLPPTPEEVEAFVDDADPKSYENLIDRLLARPQYGERWARYWLDVARFAESHGFEQDYDRPHAYHFRDFVIRALNDDLPYNDFVRWQLAGDEFAPGNPMAMMATGFLGAGVYPTQITANEVESSRYDALDDMAATTGTAFLGLTIGCARCHDHKFDPIPAGDYYRILATFTTTVRSDIDVEMPAETSGKAKVEFEREQESLASKLRTYEADELPKALAAWEASEKGKSSEPAWKVLELSEVKSQGGATFTRQPDGSHLASGANPEFDLYTLVAKVNLHGKTGLRIEALADPSFVKGGPGRAGNGNFALSNVRATVSELSGDKRASLSLSRPTATFNQGNHLHVQNTIDGDVKSAWAVDPQFGKDHAAVYEIGAQAVAAEVLLTVTLEFNNNAQHNLGRVRLSVTDQKPPLQLEGDTLPAAVRTTLAIAADQRTKEQQNALLAWFAPRDEAWRKLSEAEREHRKQAPVGKRVKMMVASEGTPPIRHHTQGGDFFPQVFFLKRGDNLQKVAPASQSFLQVLMNSDDGPKRWQESPPVGSKTSYRRRSLANWIVDAEHGAGQLAARVMVNRLWQHHFGTGIVTSPNDFGFQGDRPSHPELLDYLAAEFLAGGWKVKKMHKLLMMSGAYMQSSDLSPSKDKAHDSALREKQERLLARFPVRRLSAEAIRDAMLSVSGSLNATMYGPGTLDENHTRRSIYFMVKRSRLIPMMQLFDSPEPLVSVANRPATTIAPQALLFLNHSPVRQCAKNFANRLQPEWKASRRDALQRAYMLALSRRPSDAELETSLKFVEQQEERYTQAGQKEAPFLAIEDICQVLMSLNEFVYIE